MDVANDRTGPAAQAAATPAPVPGIQKLRITVEVDDGPPAVFLMDQATFTRKCEMDHDLEPGGVRITPSGIETLIFEGRRLPVD